MKNKQHFKHSSLLDILEKRESLLEHLNEKNRHKKCRNAIVLSFEAYLQKQIEIMHSDVNMWLTRVALGRSPTLKEAEMHFAENGGAEIFARMYTYLK